MKKPTLSPAATTTEKVAVCWLMLMASPLSAWLYCFQLDFYRLSALSQASKDASLAFSILFHAVAWGCIYLSKSQLGETP